MGHRQACRGRASCGVVVTVACLSLLVPGASPAAGSTSEAKSALKELIRDTKTVSRRGANGKARKELLKLAKQARHGFARKPCRSVRLLGDYRVALLHGANRGHARAGHRPLSDLLADLDAGAVSAVAALKTLPHSERCGGTSATTGGQVQTEVLRSDVNGLALHVTFPTARFISAEGNGKRFIEMIMENMEPLGEPGQPGVPGTTEQFAIPVGADVTVDVTNVSGYTLDGVNLFPEQPEPVDAAPDPTLPGPLPGQPPEATFLDPPFTIDKAAYKGGTFPAEQASGSPRGTLRDLLLGGVELAGGQYSPKTDKLEVFTSMDVEVRFGGANTGAFGDTRLADPFNAAFDRIYESAIPNWDTVRGNLSNKPFTFCGEELLIITPPELLPAAVTLRNARSAAGYLTAIRQTGTGPGQIGTTKEEIQAFIRSELAADCFVRPSYVILMGNTALMPTFIVPCAPGGDVAECDVASDLPYSLDGIGADYFADVALGRIPAPDLATANTVVNKIVNYENSPPAPPGDDFFRHITIGSYYEPTYICELNEGESGTPNCDPDKPPVTGHYVYHPEITKDARTFTKISEQVRDAMLAKGYSVDRLYYTGNDLDPQQYWDGTPMPAAIRKPGFAWDADSADWLAAINDGRNILFHRDHGWSGGWSHPTLGIGDVAGMTNGAQLPVAFSINCASAAFDTPGFPSFVETMLQSSTGGIVGGIGDTRVSGSWSNSILSAGLFDALFPNLLPAYGADAPLQRMGDVMLAGKLYLATGNPDAVYKHGHLYGYFGDPTMQLWIDPPLEFDPSTIKSLLHRNQPLPGPYPPGPGPDPPSFWVSVEAGQAELQGTIATLLQRGVPIGRAIVQNGQAVIVPRTNAAAGGLSIALEQGGFIAGQDSVDTG